MVELLKWIKKNYVDEEDPKFCLSIPTMYNHKKS